MASSSSTASSSSSSNRTYSEEFLRTAPLPGWVHASIGGLSGTIEVCINQPTVSWKNSLQQGLPLSFKPSVIYRGTFINAVSIAPITAIQFGVAGSLSTYLITSRRQQTQPPSSSASSSTHQLSNLETLSCSLAGGAVSSLIVCPADLLIIQQQKTGLSLVSQLQSIGQNYGYSRLTRGFTMALARESLFTAGYLGLAPILKATFSASFPSTMPEGGAAAFAASSVAAGICAGMLTHPIDTIKTRLQSDLGKDSRYKGVFTTAKIIASEAGLRGFYNGLLPRTGRICSAVFIFNQTKEWFSRVARGMGLSPETPNQL